jgi:hypothetical protein
VSEQFVGQQFLVERAAIDGDKGSGGTGAVVMQVAGEQLLAGSGLAADQHAAVGGRYLAGNLHEPLHFGVQGDDLTLPETFDLFAQRLIFTTQTYLLHGFGDDLRTSSSRNGLAM